MNFNLHFGELHSDNSINDKNNLFENYIPKCYKVNRILISFNCFSEYTILMKIITSGPSKYTMDHPEFTNLLNQTLWFDCFDSLCPSQYFFSHVGMGLPRLNQYLRGINVFCSRTQHSAAIEAQICIPSILSQALYH